MANENLNTQQTVQTAAQTAPAQTPTYAADIRNTAEGSANSAINGYVQSFAQSMGAGVDHTAQINQMYDSQLQGNLAQLEASNQINQNALNQQGVDLQKAYMQNANATAASHEIEKRNLNTQLAGNGMNVGTGSQAALSMSNAYQNAMGALNAAKMDAEAKLKQQIANLEIQYQADVTSAIMNNDYQRAAEIFADMKNREQQMTQWYQMAVSDADRRATLGDFSGYAGIYGQAMANQAQSEWQRQRDYEDQQRAQEQALYEQQMADNERKRLLQDAENRAQYGDFGAYAQLYGQDAANLAQAVWARQYPDIAYDQGYISPEEYKNITGKYPAGYNAGSNTGWNDSWYKKSLDMRDRASANANGVTMSTQDALGIGHTTTNPDDVVYNPTTGRWAVNGG